MGSIVLGRIAGIAIGIHYSWLFIAGLLTWSLAQGHFPQTFPGWDGTTYWAAGGAAALLFFASILLHELAHALVALRRGVGVRSITLFMFGGVATLNEEAETPGDELLIALAGPAMSFLIAGVSWAVSQSAPAGAAS